VEAAVGFYELYPLQPIISAVPSKLHRKCVRLEEIIAEEFTVYYELNVKADRARNLKKEFERSLRGDSVRVSISPAYKPCWSLMVLLR
jgi:hypothetical protein